MANHLGIELVPSFCRIVVLERRGGLFRSRSGAPTRIKAFHEVPYHPSSPGQLTEELRQLGVRGQAHVAVWGLKGTHRSLALPPADPTDLEAIARREAGGGDRAAELADGIMLGGPASGGQRQVTYVSVPAAEVRTSIRPLSDAGIEVVGVVTPAQVHARLAHQRFGLMSDQATAVLSVQGRVTGLTVVRGENVLFARELPWGHETERAVAGTSPAGADEFTGRVTSEVRRSLVYLKQQHQADVSRVLVCGDLPDLRSLTAPLMHDLGLDVETLDSPDGLELSDLPESADGLRSRLGAFRTALVLASGEAPTVNLLPRGGTAVRRRLTTRKQQHLWRAVAAGLVIAVLAWGAVELLARTTRDRTDSLRREVAALEPEAQRIETNRQARATDAAREAALKAFRSEGPRLARVLETLSQAAPPEVAITSLKVSPGPGLWNISVEGQALAPTPAEAQAAFNRFAKAINGTEYLGVASRAPELRVRIEEPGPAERASLDGEPAGSRTVVPQWKVVGGWEPVRSGTASRAAGNRQLESDGGRLRVTNGVLMEWVERRVSTGTIEGRTTTDVRAGTADPPKYAGAILDFTLQYEVRK